MFDAPRILTVAHLTFRSAFQGLRTVALGLLAAFPAVVVAAIAVLGQSASTTENTAQGLFLSLTLRVVVGLVVLVVAVGAFRTDIEQDTLTYLSTRSVVRPDIVIGKYLGSVGASLVFLVPAGIGPLLVAGLAGAPPPATAVSATILAVVVLASLAWGGFYLFLGLVSRNALILGLIYLFLWEELALLLPGDFPKLTLLYYLLSFSNDAVSTGPLSGSTTSVPLAQTVLPPLVVAVFFVGLTAALLRYVETAPQRTAA
jgi:ABC-2 type transport system permease protein